MSAKAFTIGFQTDKIVANTLNVNMHAVKFTRFLMICGRYLRGQKKIIVLLYLKRDEELCELTINQRKS